MGVPGIQARRSNASRGKRRGRVSGPNLFLQSRGRCRGKLLLLDDDELTAAGRWWGGSSIMAVSEGFQQLGSKDHLVADLLYSKLLSSYASTHTSLIRLFSPAIVQTQRYRFLQILSVRDTFVRQTSPSPRSRCVSGSVASSSFSTVSRATQGNAQWPYALCTFEFQGPLETFPRSRPSPSLHAHPAQVQPGLCAVPSERVCRGD